MVGRTTVAALPREQHKVRTPSTDTFKRDDSTESGWGILLFLNAFPGMAIFAAFQLLTSQQLGAAVMLNPKINLSVNPLCAGYKTWEDR